ncbi:PIG-L family deacetylase [Echinicola marina]|uniref:PIG-L family deacetylase n=1 Tax=Echinicola marina TaxID=2859768 RepID=UPI001CF6EE32|nr:PIG-L family deacetylase [Echinicola marina]UCS92653.1 PIG-L family deacetylase [Echinicola marina]
MKLKIRLLFSFILISILGQATAGEITSQPSSYIYHLLLRLNETKRVLYIAAHPDDENTRLIAYLGNKEHVQVGYMSLTRGDGGQNLIGKELGVELGMIRTQELLKARKIDGGQQFFSRAIDFGYSKNPTETLNNWDKEKLLSDVVWVIRNYQPDIIINRFNTTPGTTHGHHTTSAILSTEAFRAAADPNAFPEQLDKVDVWQAKRVFWNAYSWGGPYEPSGEAVFHSFPVGDYNDLLGTTYAQIAADSRTMHKSQGFGSTASVGDSEDIIELVDGEEFENDPFEGVENRWETITKGKEIQLALDKAISDFDFVNLENNLSNLLKVKKLLTDLDGDAKWIREKKELINEIISDVLGLKVEFLADQEEAYIGESVNASFIFNNPSSIPVKVRKIDVLHDNHDLNATVMDNEVLREKMNLSFETGEKVSQPYWIEKEPESKLYNVTDQNQIGRAFNAPTVVGIVSFEVEGQSIQMNVPLRYKFNDPVDGETKQPFVLIPAVELSIEQDQVYAIAGKPAVFNIKVKFNDKLVPGRLELEGLAQSAYKIIEQGFKEDKDKSINEISYQISINGDAKIGKTSIAAQYITDEGLIYDQGIRRINYKHIPNLTYFPKAKFDLIKLDLKTTNQRIAYIPGAGDDVAQVLQNLGYSVSILESGNIDEARLSVFSTVIVGIRAFNVNEQLVSQFDQLMKYVENGGNLIIQYNTTASLMRDQLGPYPFDITRKRVAVEDSPVSVDFLAHPVMQGPNPISMEDFDGWVQERGLYFPDNWDGKYITPLTMNDPEENPSKGSLLLANYGKGTYCYTGISWFRLLPAGVPGAIKLFVNLIEQGDE